MKYTFLSLIFILIGTASFGQSITLQGYVYESDNRGYINQSRVDILQSPSNVFITSTLTDKDGFFKADLPVGKKFLVRVSKDLFLEQEMIVDALDTKPDDKKFINVEMERKPGYIFDVTIANPRKDATVTTHGIHGATIEVFNNTTEKESVRLPDYEFPNFKVNFEQGNHYTILIRKEGYYAKRMEAYVNVKGCILCFDGVGSVEPGVSDVLTAGHQMGTLLANVELKPIVLDEKTKLDNIQYATNSAALNRMAKDELRKVVDLLKDNPGMKVELSSHTDSRGKSDMNMTLSQKRAKVASEYIASFTGVNISRIRARGYGETWLDNNCSDGVECNERQHQRNRRTEVKIVEFNQEPKSIWKPLTELKRLERMEKMLEDIQNQEIIEIPAGNKENLPDDLKKKLGIKENADNTKAKSETPKPSFDKPRPISKPINTATKEKIDSTKETVMDAAEVVIEMVDTPTKPQKSIEQMERDIEQRAAMANAKEVVADGLIMDASVPDLAVVTYKELKSLPVGYNGYKIQVHQSSEQLPASHQLFQVFGNLTSEKTPQGYAYLLGNFKEQKDAELFLKNIIKPRYASAQLVKFENGRRLIYQN